MSKNITHFTLFSTTFIGVWCKKHLLLFKNLDKFSQLITVIRLALCYHQFDVGKYCHFLIIKVKITREISSKIYRARKVGLWNYDMVLLRLPFLLFSYHPFLFIWVYSVIYIDYVINIVQSNLLPFRAESHSTLLSLRGLWWWRYDYPSN